MLARLAYRYSHSRVTVNLTAGEIAELEMQDPATASEGGYQNFLVQLGSRCNRATGELTLSNSDLERIPRYAFDYGNGGWEERLKNIFGRSLGSKLGR